LTSQKNSKQSDAESAYLFLRSMLLYIDSIMFGRMGLLD
jgi:hypothetical protein